MCCTFTFALGYLRRFRFWKQPKCEKMRHSGRTKLLKGRSQTEHLGIFPSVQEAGKKVCSGIKGIFWSNIHWYVKSGEPSRGLWLWLGGPCSPEQTPWLPAHPAPGRSGLSLEVNVEQPSAGSCPTVSVPCGPALPTFCFAGSRPLKEVK